MISLHEAKEYKKFVFIENGIGPFVSNIFINGTITYFVFKNVMEGSLPKQSILIDLISTGFLLPFITVYLAKLVIKKQVHKGKLKPISKNGLIQNAIFKLPISVFAIFISIFCLAFFTLPILTFSHYSNFESIKFMDYVYFKGIWCGIIALFHAPLIGCWILVKVSANFHENLNS